MKYLFFILLIPQFLWSDPTSTYILKSIPHNGLYSFADPRNAQMSFFLTPYGIVTLEDLYYHPQTTQVCKKEIIVFYIDHSDKRYFVQEHMYIEQKYHIEFKKDTRAVIYVQGTTTLSEILLKEGLAYVVPNFYDKEFLYRFKQAQKDARLHQKGIWKDKVLVQCMAQYNVPR